MGNNVFSGHLVIYHHHMSEYKIHVMDWLKYCFLVLFYGPILDVSSASSGEDQTVGPELENLQLT